LLEEEEDLAVHVLVDASRSMGYGEAEAHKFRYAQRLAAALGYIALAAGDRLSVTILQGAQTVAQFGPARGRGFTLRLLKFLEEQQPDGVTEISDALRTYALTSKRPGLAFLISDLFSPDGYEGGLAQLQGRGYEAALLHILAPEEMDPPLAGDLRLIDAETGAPQDISLDGGLRDLYRRRVRTWRDEIEAHCLKRRVHYVPVTTDSAWDELVLYQLRRRGLVK
jgi:uncharacterized protein (DUF58 family)